MSHLDEGTSTRCSTESSRRRGVAAIQAHLGACASCGLRLPEVQELLDEADRLIASVEMDGAAAAAPMRRVEPGAATPRPGPARAAPCRDDAPGAFASRAGPGPPPSRPGPSCPSARSPPLAPEVPVRPEPQRPASPPPRPMPDRPGSHRGVERTAAAASDARQRIHHRPADAAGAEVRLGRDDPGVRRGRRHRGAHARAR